MSRNLYEQLAGVASAADHWLLFKEVGGPCPSFNHLLVPDTFRRFLSEFLPLCPIADPRGKLIRIRKDNFPKLLSLTTRPGIVPRKASTIVELIESGKFEPSEYQWASDRIRALFWLPDLISNPDAIHRKRPHGRISAEEVYVKIYDKMGATVKLVFVNYFGKSGDPTVITSFLTDPRTAMKHCAGPPIYCRKK